MKSIKEIEKGSERFFIREFKMIIFVSFLLNGDVVCSVELRLTHPSFVLSLD